MIWIILIVLILIMDQITKFIVIKNMSMLESITLIEKFFYLTRTENKGAAWSIFQNGRYFFIVFTILILGFLGFVLYKANNKILKFSLVLIMGGAMGNLVDRIFRGSVVDFFDFYIGSYDFPIFNVADSFVVIGTFILAYYIMFIYKEPKKVEAVDEEAKKD